VINAVLSPYYAGLLGILGIGFLVRIIIKRKKVSKSIGLPKPKEFIKRDDLLQLILWAALPLIFFSLGNNKDYKYLLPALPAWGALLSLLMTWIISRIIKEPSSQRRLFCTVSGIRSLLPFLLLFPMGYFLWTSLPILPNWQSTPKGWIFYSPDVDGYTYRPRQMNWQHLKIIKAITQDASLHMQMKMEQGNLLVMLIADHASFNQNNFSYYAAYQESPLIFSAVLTRNEADWQESRRGYLLQADYLLTKTGDQGPAFTTYKNVEIRWMLESRELPYIPIARFSLPDGSESILYRKEPGF
jgi:hypothetical protein